MSKTNKNNDVVADNAEEPVEAEEQISEPEYETLVRQTEELESLYSALRIKSEKDEAMVKELNNQYLRLQADFDNFRKRSAEQSKKIKEDGISETLSKIIPILDVVNQAIKMIADEKVADGVRMIGNQVLNVLASYGVTEISALGKPFDPTYHNAVLQVSVSNPDQVGIVVEVFQDGYMLGDKILRHSVVKVGC